MLARGEGMAENPRNGRDLRYFSLAQVGVEMAAPVGIGWWVDQHLGWFPWLTALGAISGLVLGFANILMVVNRPDEPPTQTRDSTEPPPKDET
jgi:F0F1-type ATP synthase assembly protein I